MIRKNKKIRQNFRCKLIGNLKYILMRLFKITGNSNVKKQCVAQRKAIFLNVTAPLCKNL